jgi:glycosyltransferase involved in cell wall biosynthesis
VHEWVASRAGSEKVFERLAGLFPDADLYTLMSEPGVHLDLGGRTLRSSALDRPVFRQRRWLALPFMPWAWRRLARHADYDLVVTSSHALAREFGRRTRARRHLCYVHTPIRYAWTREIDPRARSRFAGLASRALQQVDRASVPRVDSFACNSTTTRERIRRFYGRDARVIFPPVDVEFFARPAGERACDGHLLAAGRWVDYKRFDLAIEVAARLGAPLTIAGHGPAGPQLRRLAEERRAAVRFESAPSDERLRALMQRSSVLLFPGVEDFGIVPVEAQAAGLPVVGPNEGGLQDTVDHGRTGWLVDDATVASLADGVRQVWERGMGGAPCRSWATRFAAEHFDRAVVDWLRDEAEPRHSSGG